MTSKDRLNEILKAFKIKAECISHSEVRNISLYDLHLEPGVRVKSIQKFSEEIALMMRSKHKPLFKVFSENGIVRMEIIQGSSPKISFYDEIGKINFQDTKIPMYIGPSTEGNDVVFDMAKNPHLLVAGCTGSGKSTLLHTLLANFLNIPNIKIYISDTKNVEFSHYQSLKNVKIAGDYNSTMALIDCLQIEMEERYDLIKTLFLSYRNIGQELPPIVFIIDEFSDLIMQDTDKRLQRSLCRLVQKCRAANIFCVLATQRPSADILTGSIKANFPARIACKVASGVDAKIVLGTTGAELLAGNGDAIINNYNHDYKRFQVAYTSPAAILEKYSSKLLSA
jgi:S-DNA-T family DNA segregation ATPase FtsK/SpoIIIE